MECLHNVFGLVILPDERTNGRTDERTNRPTDRRTDELTTGLRELDYNFTLYFTRSMWVKQVEWPPVGVAPGVSG